MKIAIMVLLVAGITGMITSFAGCSPGQEASYNTSGYSLVGNWQIVSKFTQHGSDTSTVFGTTSDYFDFTSQGGAYFKLGTDIDSATYTASAGAITMSYTYLNGMSVPAGTAGPGYIITTLTAQNATLSQSATTPGGVFLLVYKLKRK